MKDETPDSSPSPTERARAAYLQRTLAEYSRLYYTEGVSQVSDAEYDRLYRELATLERKYPELEDGSSPTQVVGSPV